MVESTSATSRKPLSTAASSTPEAAGGSSEPTLLVLDAASLAQLPAELFDFLARCVPSRDLWKWLSAKEQDELTYTITRGFQRTPHVVRQNVVRHRLAQHLQQNPTDFNALLRLWSQTRPTPAALNAVRELTTGASDAAILAGLPTLWQHHGGEAVIAALLLQDRFDLLESVDALGPGETPAAPAERMESAPLPVPAASQPGPELEAARAEVRAKQQEIQKLKEQQGAHKQKAQSVEKTLKAALEHEKQRAVALEAQLSESQRLHDRTSRRLRSLERDTEELTAEDKRLKRQLRRQQQLNEELRKQLAAAAARLDALVPKTPTPAPTPKPAAAKPVARLKATSPLDQQFIWKSDRRPFNVTPRQVKQAIDANNEEFVFRLVQAFDALRETNPQGYRLFLDRIREFDRYYSRVLTADTTRVLVDASNVARFEKDRRGKGQLRHLLAMRDELRRRDCFPVAIYADASLPYHIDEPEELLRMVKTGEVILTLAGQEADELLAREARRTGAYVVTNDRAFHTKVTPDFEPPRITFRIHDGVLIVDDF